MWQKTKNVYHLSVAILANIYFRFPGRKLKIIGVTGTDGKTTTVNLIYHILKTAGKSVSMVSTVGANINGTVSPLKFHVTTPHALEIQRFLSDATKTKEKERYVVLEVSSHSIDQFRIWGIPFEVGVITNVTSEHLDYHKTYDNYLYTKAKLLQRAKTAIINRDDRSYEKLHPILLHKYVKTYGIYNTADIMQKDYNYPSSLVGEFNRYNILAAIATCQTFGIDEDVIKKAIATFQTPKGRMNEFPNTRDLKIIIDYAHTPNGLEQVLKALQKEKKSSSRIIALIGAEGDRDPGKRQTMGEIAGRLADIVIITAVDPRGNTQEINKAILRGVEKGGGKLGSTAFVEPDREKAIHMAMNILSKKGDVIGLFGKGHERSINYDGKNEIPWSDEEVVKKVLKRAQSR